MTSDKLKETMRTVLVYVVGDTEFVIKEAYKRIEELESAVDAANTTIARLKGIATNDQSSSSAIGIARHR